MGKPADGLIAAICAIAVCVVLAAAVLAVYWQAVDFAFIEEDDSVYITRNPYVQQGLTPETARWALVGVVASNWHPLTVLSLMADTTLAGGPNSGMYHLTNIALHLANTLILFLLLIRLTRRFWPSALVAAVFAVHPLHVESVAWISERKDVLSMLLWLLTTWTYVRYTEKRTIARYVLVAVLFVLGLTAKPMLVTLPVILLLIDYWPLGRFRAESVENLIREKAPLLALSLLSGWITYNVQRAGGLTGMARFSLPIRVDNAIVSTAKYLWKMIWPSHLACFYPHLGTSLPLWELVGSAALIVALSVVAIRCARSRPYVAMGWFWYLIALIPVIGLVQVGSQGMADRYTYVPMIGVTIAVAWLLADALKRRLGSRSDAVLGALCLVVIVGLAVPAYRQVGYWRSGVTLWTRAVQVNPRDPGVRYNLGCALDDEERTDDAIAQFNTALRINPADSDIYNRLALDLVRQERYPEAERLARKAVRLWPDSAEANVNLGLILEQQAKLDEAIARFRRAVELAPREEAFREHLARVLSQR